MNAKTRALGIGIVLTYSGVALAQGTALGPTTLHEIEVQNDRAYAGGANDVINGPLPYPIDLDINGQPWTKQIDTPPDASYTGGLVDIFESITNAGTEPWDGWHADLFGGGLGVGWNNSGVVSAQVNGSSISYDQTVTVASLSIRGFSQPVLPGDTLELHKRIDIFTDNVVGPGQTLFSIEQFPTPEPASAAMLIAVGLGLFLMAVPQVIPVFVGQCSPSWWTADAPDASNCAVMRSGLRRSRPRFMLSTLPSHNQKRPNAVGVSDRTHYKNDRALVAKLGLANPLFINGRNRSR